MLALVDHLTPAGAARSERHVAAALGAFVHLAELWRLTDEERCALLGGIGRSTLHEWRRQPRRTVGEDVMTRLSLVLGIHAALVRLFPEAPPGEAARRVRRPLATPVTCGRSILEHLLAQGIPGMVELRAYLESESGGGGLLAGPGLGTLAPTG